MRSWPIALALVAGVALCLVTWFGGVAAAVAGVLAQPALALAIAAWRQRVELVSWSAWRRNGLSLTAAWAAAAAVFALAAAWPLSVLLDSGSLPAALALSVLAGLFVLALWRTWPVWQGLERDGGAVLDHWRVLGEVDAGAWRGLGVAVVIAVLAGSVLVLAWPGVVTGAGRWAWVIGLALASPAVHLWLQKVAPAEPLLMLGDEPGDDDAARDLALEAADASGGSLNPALYTAARTGRVERALDLLDAGADPHAAPPADERDQRTLPVLAAVLPDLRLLRALIARGVDLNAAHAGMTPLIAATRDSWHGRPDAVMTLLANGADPRALDSDGNTPLHHAARSSDPGVAALLRDAAAELDPLNHDGLTPLGVACAAGNWRLARFLLERGARPDPLDGQPALLAAAGGEDDDPAGVHLLLKQKAKVDARDRRGRTALHEAAFAGHVDMATTLLAAGADPAVIDDQGRNAVLEAARGGHLTVLERVLEQLPRGGTAEAASLDAAGRNALALACTSEHGTPALITRLLELGVDRDQRDLEGKRAIDRAAEAGRWALVAALDAGYAVPAAVSDGQLDQNQPLPDRAPTGLLRDALREGREHGLDGLAQLLSPTELGALLHDEGRLDDGVMDNGPSNDRVDNHRVDHHHLPSPQQIEWLLARGADPEVRNGAGDVPLFAWLERGASAVPQVQALLRRGVSAAGRGGLARFLAGCAAGEHAARSLENSALDLLDRGADPFAASAAGDPPLALAVRLGWSRLLLRLVAAGVDLDVRDSHGMSALHLAAALGREAMLKQLIAHGATPDQLAADGQTPLGVALSSGRRDLADWLDWRGWALPRRPLQASDVPAAAIVGDADAVRRLLDLGLPVDAADSQGCTALLRAAGGGHRAVVDLLLARGADPLCAANSGATALSAAVSMRHTDIVDRLLAAGATLEQRLPGELTVLMVACALGLPDLAARLLAAGADVQASDAQGRTPIHCAAMYGFGARERSHLVALLDTLLLAGAEADQPDQSGQHAAGAGATPLLLLLGARAEPGSAADEEVLIAGLQLLLDQDARLDAQDPRGFGPLHLAALHGLLRVVQWLLHAGADPDLRDALNRPPREIAVMRGFVDIAAEFQPPTPGNQVSMARFLRDQN